MIEVKVTDDLVEVATIILVEDLENCSGDEVLSYDVTITVDRGPSIGCYNRRIEDWPVKAINYMGLFKAVLSQLDDEHIAIEETDDDDPASYEATGTPALARQLNRLVREIQAGPS